MLLSMNMFRKKFLNFLKKFKLKYIVFVVILILVLFLIYPIIQPPAYPFEPEQRTVNSLLTKRELRRAFESYAGDLKCRNVSMTLVAINSGANNFNKRQAIRESWAKWVNESNQTLLFFTSKPTDEFLGKELELENYHYNDLIILPIKESYYLLPFKVLAMINWSINQCSHIKHFIKCDDDMFLNWPNLNQFLIDHRNQTSSVYGKANLNSKPNRDRHSRWYMPYDEYAKNTYPTFVGEFTLIKSTNSKPKSN